MRDVNPVLMAEAVADDRPIAVRRKRRASSALTSSPVKPEARASGIKSALFSETKAPRAKKRVRFSYPPDATLASERTTAEDEQSTGITPFVARTTLLDNNGQSAISTQGMLRYPPRRRRSTCNASRGSDDSLQLSSSNLQTQFSLADPALSERSKRRLARSHVSEVMNDLETEQRRHRLHQQELLRARHEIEELKAGGNNVTGPEKRVHELEIEVRLLKERLQEADNERISNPDLVEPFVAGSASESKSDEIMLIDSGYNCSAASSPATPLTPISGGTASTSIQVTPGTPASTQTELTAMSIGKLHAHFDSQVKILASARIELERILPGETPLPLSSPSEAISMWKSTPSPSQGYLGGAAQNLVLADAEPLLNAALRHVRNMKNRVTETTKELSISEGQRINVVANFRTALKQLEEARQARAMLIAESQTRPSSGSERASTSATERRRITDDDVKACELEEATEQLKQLQEKVATYERDRSSLVAALNKYREEIKDMECLIGTLETENSLAIQDLKGSHSQNLEKLIAEHAQAVDDLEARVASETQGRREAESEIDRVMIRWADHREKGEREVGLLGVKIADLDEAVRLRDKEVESLRKELAKLQDHVRTFVGGLGVNTDSLAIDDTPHTPVEEPCLPEHIPKQFTSHLKLPARVGRWGLLTPHVEGGRFHDVACGISPELSSDASMGADSIPGEVEMERGKRNRTGRRNDSGIGILMEAEHEQ